MTSDQTTGTLPAPSPVSDRAVVRFKAACAETGLSARTMRRLIAAGRGPRVLRLSERCLGIRRADLDAWIESRAGGSTE